jgi:hypothetical protein
VARDFDPCDVADPALPSFHTTDVFASAGSCFASNIRPFLERAQLRYLKTEGPHPLWPEGAEASYYDAFSARYGNIYTARQLLQLLKRALGIFHPLEDRWIVAGEVIDPFRPGLKWRPSSKREFEAITAQHLSAVRRVFEQSTVFIFTLGLTEAWESAVDGAVFPACPGTIAGAFDPARHRSHNFSVEEIVADLLEFVDLVTPMNPSLRIVLTVSPVPLVATATDRHVVTATAYSKAVLRVAADVVVRQRQNVCYFPSYELVTGPQASPDTFEADRRNVSAKAVAQVMRTFFHAFGLPNGSEGLDAGAEPPLRPVSTADAIHAEVADAIRQLCEEEMADEAIR